MCKTRVALEVIQKDKNRCGMSEQQVYLIEKVCDDIDGVYKVSKDTLAIAQELKDIVQKQQSFIANVKSFCTNKITLLLLSILIIKYIGVDAYQAIAASPLFP